MIICKILFEKLPDRLCVIICGFTYIVGCVFRTYLEIDTSVMLKRCRKQKHTYIVSIIFIVYPIYSGIIYIITHYFSIKMGTAISILNAIVMFIYLMSIHYVIIKMEKSKIRNLSCMGRYYIRKFMNKKDRYYILCMGLPTGFLKIVF